MSSLSDVIQSDTVTAAKQRRESELSTLRLLRAGLKNRQIDLGHTLTDEEVLSVIRTQVRQLQDALAASQQASRAEAVEKAKDELMVLQRYLPTPLSDEALTALARSILSEHGFISRTDLGKAIGLVVKAADGKADGSRVKAAVEVLLS